MSEITESYDLVVGTKRQVTIPAGLLRRLSLREGDHLRVTVTKDGVAALEPMVSVPRSMVSNALLEEMNARRGAKANDMTLAEFNLWRRNQSEAGGKTAKVNEKPDAFFGEKGRGAEITPLHERILQRRVEEVEGLRGGVLIPERAAQRPLAARGQTAHPYRKKSGALVEARAELKSR